MTADPHATQDREAILEHLWGGGTEVSFEEFDTARDLERDGLIRIRHRGVTHWKAEITALGRQVRQETVDG